MVIHFPVCVLWRVSKRSAVGSRTSPQPKRLETTTADGTVALHPELFRAATECNEFRFSFRFIVQLLSERRTGRPVAVEMVSLYFTPYHPSRPVSNAVSQQSITPRKGSNKNAGALKRFSDHYRSNASSAVRHLLESAFNNYHWLARWNWKIMRFPCDGGIVFVYMGMFFFVHTSPPDQLRPRVSMAMTRRDCGCND